MKLLAAAAAVALASSVAMADGPSPQPQWLGYPDIYYPYGGVMLPQTVAGGSKGVGTINAQGVYVNGVQVLTALPTIAANTVLGNGTASPAVAAALTIPSCSAANDALKWTAGVGFGCNSAIVAALAVGTSPVTGGTSGYVEYNNAGVLGEKATTGVGGVVLAQYPSILGLAVTGSFTATGLVTNADLANSSLTIAGHSVSLGGSQALAAADLSNGTTGSGSVVLATSPTIASPTVTGSFTATGLVTNADLVNSAMTIAGHSVALGGSQALAASDLSNGTTGSGSVVLATSPSISGVTITGSLTATGLVTNADLSNSATTVNGQTCTLGSTCTAAAAAGTLTGATLASGVTASSLTSVGTISSGTWQGTAIANAYLANSSLTIAGHSVSLGGSQALAASDLSNGTTGSGAVVLATSPTINGTLGIGTSSIPGDTVLDVYSAAQSKIRACTASYCASMQGNDGGGAAILAAEGNYPLQFYTNSTLAAAFATNDSLLLYANPASAVAIDVSAQTAISVSSGSNAALPGSASGLVIITDQGFGDPGVYLVGGGNSFRISGTANWVSPTTTPTSGTYSIQWDGSSSYRIYNNRTSSGPFNVMFLKTRNST